jgi:cytochrome c oxidase assembly protein subunit 15
MTDLSPRQAEALPAVRLWLVVVAVLIFAMVIVGGATRLTDSGLSITEWDPIMGAIPPLTEAQWIDAFARYKLIPQAQILNPDMTLGGFKFIFWWEWSHRFLGRFIGAAFLLPFIYFAVSGAVGRGLWPKLAIIFVLGGLQGALGWYMVASGLVDRVDVSQYRLAAHLSLAVFLFAAIVWVTLGLSTRRRRPVDPAGRDALIVVVLVFLQIAAGAFVAGLDAGQGYNTWPLMAGELVPKGLFVMQPWWRNFFENAMTVQFDHRLIAYVVFVAIAAHAYIRQTREALLLFAAALVQVGLGIWTLLWQVPLWLGLLHQAGAMIVFTAALWNLSATLSRSPAASRR